ncbi:leucine-rich repeat domain-containing protein [archaeon]|nr:MAG: leucine-rich repeat domain-containing protein [archaeon]
MQTLVLRSCLVSHMEGLETCQGLEKLELYDNHIEYITGIQTLHSLRILDLSFNSIRQLVDLGRSVPRLQELYVAQNKLRKIEGLQGLPHLRLLDLGANRIRAIEGLENCTQLRSLWLGKNKIEQIEGLETLSELEQLDIQNNRLTDLGQGLVHLSKLRELYLACNKIPSVVGLPVPGVLSTVDLSTNNVQSVQGIEQLPSLQEVWMSSSALSSFDALTPFTKLPRLTCLYLEHSPIAKDFEYRMQLAKMIPSLEQLDATNVHRPST